MSQKSTLNRLIINTPLNSFEKIYQEHYRSLYSIGMKMLPDREVVRDILQDVFLSFLESIRNGREVLHPKSYLVRATLNRCYDTGMRNKRYERIEGMTLTEPLAVEQGKSNYEAVYMALSGLKEQEKKLVVLYSEGYSYREMAGITDINYSSIGKTLSRTLLKMKEAIKKLDYELSQR